MRDKAFIEDRKQKLSELTAGFCDSHLDEEYQQLCEKLIQKMARKRTVPFRSGRLEIWAAAIIYALGQINFLFDHSFEPYASADDICNYFGTSKSTTSQKAKLIRDMFRMTYFDDTFSTAHVRENDPFLNLVMQDGLIMFKDDASQSSEPLTTLQEEEPQRGREYVDKGHALSGEFYNLCDELSDAKRSGRNISAVKKRLKQLIERDPDFFDPYLLLCDLFLDEDNPQEAERLLNTAYERALNLITDTKGNWPDVLEWGWLENRHIIRAILEKAIASWYCGENESALDLLRKVLKSNPGDNVGARNYILAIRMGMSCDEFDTRFDKGGYYDSDLVNWFEANYKNFPDEFEWWEKEMEKYA
ncbi:MAG: hypothetical protein JW945_06735 [Methanomicrobia archaeon]|nr:hypothetical protein [Methanomicrobia archaeon]